MHGSNCTLSSQVTQIILQITGIIGRVKWGENLSVSMKYPFKLEEHQLDFQLHKASKEWIGWLMGWK